MKITVFGGSPKGMQSVTMQYMKYLQNSFPDHDFSMIPAAGRISVLERRPEELKAVVEKAGESDLVIWAFPLYYMLCCSQYKRFIELLFQRYSNALKGIPAAVFTTSIRFFDHTAHDYMRGISQDLGMPFAGGYSAESSDLFRQGERSRLELFFQTTVKRVREKSFLPPVPGMESAGIQGYSPENTETADAHGGWLVLADLEGAGKNLRGMVKGFVSATGGKAEVVDISKIDFKPCTGCCRCGLENKCVHGEDAFVKLHRNTVMKADVIVLAGEIRDRYLSSTWKRFFDRSFYMGHTPSLKGKQVGFLVSGTLSLTPVLREVLTAWSEFQGVALCGIVSDEVPDSKELDRVLSSLAVNLENGRATGYIPPGTFRETAGFKLFRDCIWGPLRPVFQADHRYYRKNGLYDFPWKKPGTVLMNMFVPALLRLPPVKKRFQGAMPGAMIRRFQSVVE